MQTRVLAAGPDAVAEAADVIRRGGLVAFPTETVYGLGANAFDSAAVGRIYAAKERPAADPLIVHLARADELESVAASVPQVAWELARRFWPGPLTLVLPRSSRVPSIVAAGGDTVAVRVPAHPLAAALIDAARLPIAAPSANRYARPSPTTAAHVLADLDGRIDLVVDGGPTSVGVESTVLDLTGGRPRLLRPGGVTLEALGGVLGDAIASDAPPIDDIRSPGTAQRHYSPRARVDLFDGPGAAEAAAGHAVALAGRGVHVGALAFDGDPLAAVHLEQVRVERLGGSDRDAASRLFGALRALDDAGVEAIVVRQPSPVGLGLAIRDRLRRAANGRVLTAADVGVER